MLMLIYVLSHNHSACSSSHFILVHFRLLLCKSSEPAIQKGYEYLVLLLCVLWVLFHWLCTWRSWVMLLIAPLTNRSDQIHVYIIYASDNTETKHISELISESIYRACSIGWYMPMQNLRDFILTATKRGLGTRIKVTIYQSKG
jgi:hypothetical protein